MSPFKGWDRNLRFSNRTAMWWCFITKYDPQAALMVEYLMYPVFKEERCGSVCCPDLSVLIYPLTLTAGLLAFLSMFLFEYEWRQLHKPILISLTRCVCWKIVLITLSDYRILYWFSMATISNCHKLQNTDVLSYSSGVQMQEIGLTG